MQLPRGRKDCWTVCLLSDKCARALMVSARVMSSALEYKINPGQELVGAMERVGPRDWLFVIERVEELQLDVGAHDDL